MWKYFFYRFAQVIIHCMSRRHAYAFARFLSDLQFRWSPRDRAAVIRNLRQITGSENNLPSMAREVFRHFGQYLVDFFLMYQVDEKFVREHVRVERYDYLTQALAQGKGGIILTAHIGNWEMGAAVLAKMGHPVTAIALPHKERSVNNLFNRQREHHGVTVVPTNIAVRRCVEALRKGQLIALLGDRDFGSFGEPMMFLGRKTLIPKGAAFFSYRTGAPLIPSFLVPDGKGGYVLTFFPPIFPEKDSEKQVIASLMTQYAAVIETKIREIPTQWLMFRDFGVDHG